MAFGASTRKVLICLQKSDLCIYVVSNPGLRPLFRVLHHICQRPYRVRRQYIVNSRKSNVPGPFPPPVRPSHGLTRIDSVHKLCE